MSNIVKFRKPKNITIRGAARSAMSEATGSIKKLTAVVIVAIGSEGEISMRSVNYEDDFDMLSRAGAIIERERQNLLTTSS